MQLNMATLRQMLVAVLGVDEKYIVPRQGNWFNPQAELPADQKPRTWCGYMIENDEPLDLPHYEPDADGSEPENYSVQHRNAWIALQFVGPEAETTAQSVGHWLQRQDVQDQLDRFDARLYSDSRVSPVAFAQQGANTVIAYTVRIRILWKSVIHADQQIVRQASFEGVIDYDV